MSKFTKADTAIFDTILPYCKSIGFTDTLFDVDHFPSGSNYYIRTKYSAFACMRKVGSQIDFCVEYFGHNDEEIYTLACPNIETACNTLKFVNEMLSAISKRLDNLL